MQQSFLLDFSPIRRDRGKSPETRHLTPRISKWFWFSGFGATVTRPLVHHSTLVEREDAFPVVLHADNSPTLLLGFVESLVETANVESASGLQIPFFEFLRSRAERAELVHSRARGREAERLKRFGEHFVEVIPGGGPGADVRTEMLAGLFRNERRPVVDQDRVEGGGVVRPGQRGHCSGP